MNKAASEPIDPLLLSALGLNPSDPVVHFVHGTPYLSEFHGQLEGIGRGDFGEGFYVYVASGRQGDWGVRSAVEWARLKATNPPDPSATPGIIYFEMSMARFAALTIHWVTDSELDAAFLLLHEAGKTESDVVVGRLIKKSATGRQPWMAYPLQLKFEDHACVYLREVRRSRVD